ncbi:hypothetical protein AMTR_s00026p00058070 [Amborella trichopoda]|uniref:Uncharacterized protein n=1 Tax=Amborella trichopoda TaxID=13333 RepID=W1PQK9_AMBTC|nr:hypothetical protein AMTR_s00026p00058070 [Amborella trichopoda]
MESSLLWCEMIHFKHGTVELVWFPKRTSIVASSNFWEGINVRRNPLMSNVRLKMNNGQNILSENDHQIGTKLSKTPGQTFSHLPITQEPLLPDI